jgi:hypothetical protein
MCRSAALRQRWAGSRAADRAYCPTMQILAKLATFMTFIGIAAFSALWTAYVFHDELGIPGKRSVPMPYYLQYSQRARSSLAFIGTDWASGSKVRRALD